MTDHEELLISIYKDLRDKLDKGDKYSLIKASGLIRQLLIDSAPLIDLVNRDYRLKILYRTQKHRPKFGQKFVINGQVIETIIGVTHINPKHNNETSILFLKREEFLGYQVIYFAGQYFTVLEIMKLCAHVYGGVHSGKIEDKKDYTLDQANKSLSYDDGLTCVVKSLGDITAIILDAIKPLVDAVNAKYNAA